MRIIGLGSTAQVGKDTIASYLEWRYLLEERDPCKVKRVAFADKLKEVAMGLFGLSYEQCYGSKEEKETIDPRFNKSPRQIMQELGAKMREIYPDIWVDTLFITVLPPLQVQGYNTFVVSDVRYPNEAAKIHAAGGFVVKVTRPNSGTDVGASHASEVSMDNYSAFDFHINNNGSLEELYTQVDSMMEEINGGKTRRDVYRR